MAEITLVSYAYKYAINNDDKKVEMKDLITQEFISMNNHVADKAIVVMTLLRKDRLRTGTPGMGANRDDHPLFSQVTELMADGTDIKLYKNALFRARNRAPKYVKQINNSKYAKYFTGGFTITDLLDLYTGKENISLFGSAENYGEW